MKETKRELIMKLPCNATTKEHLAQRIRDWLLVVEGGPKAKLFSAKQLTEKLRILLSLTDEEHNESRDRFARPFVGPYARGKDTHLDKIVGRGEAPKRYGDDHL